MKFVETGIEMLRLGFGEYLGKPICERRLDGLSLTLTAYAPGTKSPWHIHEFPTLFILLAGQHFDENRRTSFEQTPLSAVFHPTSGPHAMAVGPGGLVGINLEVTDEWLERCQLHRRDLALDYRLLDSPSARLLGLRLAASAIEEAATAEGDAETATTELLACLVRKAALTARTPPWLARATEFLAASSDRSVRLRDVAVEVNVHPVYCARAFRRAIGCTVSTYLQVLRLLAAGRLILDGRQSLVEAALRAGFSDQAHLTRTCSRVLGFTPGRLKRLRQEW